jgi:3-keto-disaccharide hydrolase
LQSFTAPSVLNPGSWNDVEITVRNHRYTVSINNQQTTDFTNPRNNLVTDTPGLPLKSRGLPFSEEPLSGYIGIQAHTGNVAYRNIRIKRL